jgi:hypothetical protein
VLQQLRARRLSARVKEERVKEELVSVSSDDTKPAEPPGGAEAAAPLAEGAPLDADDLPLRSLPASGHANPKRRQPAAARSTTAQKT